MKIMVLTGMLAIQSFRSLAGESFVDLGTVSVNVPLLRSVSYSNPGRRPVRIETVETSCGCLRILSYPAEVATGSAAEISYELTPEKPGDYAYELAVQPASGTPEVFVLNVQVQESLPVVTTKRSARLPVRVISARDDSLYISQENVRADPSAFFFVDVRSQRDFQLCRIPGAINLFHSFIRTRPDLKAKPIVLVDGGWGDPQLEKTVRKLRAGGFASVQILYGGMTAWRMAGGEVCGTRPGLYSLSEISASEYLNSRDFADWMVLDLSESSGVFLPEGVPVDFSGDTEGLLRRLQSAGPRRVLITDE